ncbi:MAG: hypothetical protein WC830_12065 [Burkholderiales bacterium]|jgi:hypothetical protein
MSPRVELEADLAQAQAGWRRANEAWAKENAARRGSCALAPIV